MASHNVVSVLTSWSKRLLAEEKAGTEAAELGPDHEDRAFALQVKGFAFFRRLRDQRPQCKGHLRH